MGERTQITMDSGLQRRAHARAEELGISFAEYVRRIVSRDLGQPKGRRDVTVLFDLVDNGEPSDIARDKDAMVAEAVWRKHTRKSKPRRAGKRDGRPARRKR